MKYGLLACGEVGSAIKEVYENAGHSILIEDPKLNKDELEMDIDILNVCVPYHSNNQFMDAVIPVLACYAPETIVIHSTVGIGVTYTINQMGYNAVHSPVRGVHPHLYEGVKTFVKYIGYDSEETGQKVNDHFTEMGVTCKMIQGSKNTEAGKLWSTTQYGLNVILEKHIHKFCKENNLNYDAIYRDFNETYNSGYEIINDNRFRKYVMNHMDGEVGGHCILPNCEILFDEHDDKLAASILLMNGGFVK